MARHDSQRQPALGRHKIVFLSLIRLISDHELHLFIARNTL